MKLSLGFSPCPNDTFIFDAMVHGKIDTNGYQFDLIMEDVEELNKRCLNNEVDICKLSYHAFTYVHKEYQMLNAGSALGRGVGPLLITQMPYNLHDVDRLKIAIPGKYTSANFLFESAFPDSNNTVIMHFADIEEAVLSGQVDAGLIIHENRFTYEDRGLIKLIDLGEYWEAKTAMPIPLGGIAIKRSLPEEIKVSIDRILRKSIEFASKNPDESKTFVLDHAQEMDKQVLKKHIDTYVNDYSIDLGIEGKMAVSTMFSAKTGLSIEEISKYQLFVS